MDGCLRSEIQCPVNIRQLLSRPMTRLAGEAIKVLEAMGECVSEMKMVNLRPYITAVDAAALDLQKELQEKATLLITPTPGTDRYGLDRNIASCIRGWNSYIWISVQT